MAIANLVCRSGVGPAATIAYFVTHGLGDYGTTTTPSVGNPRRGTKKRWHKARRKDQTLQQYVEESYRELSEAELPQEVAAKVSRSIAAVMPTWPDKFGNLPGGGEIDFKTLARNADAIEAIMEGLDIAKTLRAQRSQDALFFLLLM